MADHKPLYRWSLQDAVTHNEVQDWRDSYRENCDCARAIERAIADQYHDNILENGTKDIIDRYGFDRVNWVLANTLQEKAHDGRFSQENKRWAKGFYIPRDDVRWHFCVESHPGLTDLFINQTREAWQKLGLFEPQSCISEKDGEIDYKGRLLVLKPTVLKESYAAACSVSDRVLFQMLKDNPNISEVFLCMDSDEPGQTAAKRISDKLFTQGINAKILVPEHKDWNEDLLALNQEESEVEEPCQVLQL